MEISRAGADVHALLAKGDFSFDVTAEALPPFDGGRLGEVRPLPPHRKTYPPPSALGAADGRLTLLAREEERLAGFMVLSRRWNGLAGIDDLAVERGFRRRGVARRLLDEAADWARAEALAGLFAETQTNNIDACRFYEASGFVLAGFDRLFYAATAHRAETALFWYKLF